MRTSKDKALKAVGYEPAPYSINNESPHSNMSWPALRALAIPAGSNVLAAALVWPIGFAGILLSPVIALLIGGFVAAAVARVKPHIAWLAGTICSPWFIFVVSDPRGARHDYVPDGFGGVLFVPLLICGFLGAVFGTFVGYASTYED